MNPKCIQAINAAAGRILSSAEVRRIEGVLESAGARLAEAERGTWQSRSLEERTAMVADQAERDLLSQAQQKRDAAIRQLYESVQGAMPKPLVSKPETATSYEQFAENRARDLATEHPDMTVMLADGEVVSLAEAMRLSDRAFEQNTSDAQLASVAAECFVRSGEGLGVRAGSGVAAPAAGGLARAVGRRAADLGEKALGAAAYLIG